MDHKENSSKDNNKKYRISKIIGRTLLTLLLLILVLLLFIRSQWGQDIIVDKVTSYISDKTNTRVEIDRLFISFDGNLVVEELFLDTPKGDTLIYSNYLEADVPLWSIIRGEAVGVEEIYSKGLTARIIRKDSLSGFNFQFLLDALKRRDTTTIATDNPSDPKDIIIGDILFENADIIYNDAVNGINSQFIVGKLELEMDQLDIDLMKFSAYEGLVENTIINYTQRDVPSDPTEEGTPLPILSIDALTVKNTTGAINMSDSGILVNFNAPSLYTEAPKADFENNSFDLHTIVLKSGKIDIDMTTPENDATSLTSQIDPYLWAVYDLTIDEIAIENTIVNYAVDGARPRKGYFNQDAVSLRRINIAAKNLFLKEESFGVGVDILNGLEASGLNLKSFEGNLRVDNAGLAGNSVSLVLNKNIIKGNFNLKYDSLDIFINNPDQTYVALQLPRFTIDLRDAYRFLPSLRKNEYFNELSKFPISGTIRSNGTFASADINTLDISWSKTIISGQGSIKNVTDLDALTYNFSNFAITSKKSDVLKFIDEEELGISIPSTIKLEGSLGGTLNSLATNASLVTDQGKLGLEGAFQLGEPIVFNADLVITEYDLGNLFGNDQLGKLSGRLEANGNGSSINSLDAELDARINSFNYKGYEMKDVPINASIINGAGTINANYKDEAINLVLTSAVKLDSTAPEFRVDLNLIGANFEKLGVMQRDVRAGVKVRAFFKGNTTSYNANAIFEDGVVVYNNDTYLLGSLETRARVRPDTTTVEIENKMLDVKLESNADPLRFATAIQDHVNSYFYRDAVVTDTINNPVNLTLRGKIAQAPLLNEVFLVNVKDLDTITIGIDFEQAKRKLDASVYAPHINYSGNELDSLAFTMNTTDQTFDFDLGFVGITAGPIAIGTTKIEGKQKNNALGLHFKATNAEDVLVDIAASITGNRDRLVFQIDDEKLIFNKHPWDIPTTNEVILTEKKLDFNDFRFKRNKQEINFSNSLPNISRDHIGLAFKNFKLQEFLTYFNPDQELAEGNLSGDFIIQEPFEDIGFLADLAISNFGIMDVDMGTLDLKGNALNGNTYDFNLTIAGGAVDLDATGDYQADVNGADVAMDLAINEFRMEALEGFSRGEITKGSGSFTGDFKIEGKLANPTYNGNLQFSDAQFTINRFNSSFVLPKETVSIDNKGISVNNFTIKDVQDNSLIIDGNIGTKSILNPSFNLRIKATDFMALNATEEDNDLIYGKAVLNAEATINGDLNIPIVSLKATATSETDIVYVMPASTANIESREGIVLFVNRKNPDAILTQNEEETATLTGFDIKAFFSVASGAQIKIIIDPSTGDNVQVYGEGDLNFGLQPNGRMTLSGSYEMAGGSYEMNLYNLINRTFDIAAGSRISWYGDPFDAKLDVKAIYKLETSASPLMAPASSNSDPVARGRYREVLPFYVYLNVDGQLLSPKLSFGLDMPEDEQGAIGGQVYGRVQQVNQQDGELNRQVFSLLVLNRFYPDPGSDGSRGGVANIARDNLNDALADQLNVFSDKLLGTSGVEVDFGLDSYTDYQGDTPQARTQLDIAAQKKLFDDRLIVRVGSAIDVQGESQNPDGAPLVGNVSLEYVLTEDGRYRIKGFRRNEFENVIDGQTIVSGIGLIFSQEFNRFSELWAALLRKKQMQLQEEEKKKEVEKDKGALNQSKENNE